jgi:Flp pilus assembly protein TadD
MSRVLVAIVLAVALMVLGVCLYSRLRQTGEAVIDDPRYSSPFLNVRPDVKYVGDESCARCHESEANSYKHHPMGRSAAPIAQIVGLEEYDSSRHNPFSAAGFQFSVEHREDQVFHKEVRFDREGKSQTEFEVEVKYVIGSGTRGRSYAIDRDGYLFQSAIGWFNRHGVWDLSPGFERNPHSDRAITAECLFCHCNRVEPVEHSLNHYHLPVFHGYTIGCERCHGPGELHVRRHTEESELNDLDDTIVNPARLEPALREAVCQQCHLQGQKRILKRGRRPFDFRPGLPFEIFWSVFVKPPETSEELLAVGQVEQMQSSRCFRASDGKLGCVSCHDPHVDPLPAVRVGFYRARCLNCHIESSCSLPLAVRRQTSNEDSCVACHMPRFQSADVAHTAVTDHRIRGHAQAEDARQHIREAAEKPLDLAGRLLVSFRSGSAPALNDESSRDWAIALVKLAENYQGDRKARRRFAEPALLALEKAVQASRDDLPAMVAKGIALWLLDRPQEGFAAFESVLAIAPQREEALSAAATLSARLGRHDDAIGYWRRALAVNPWITRYHSELAKSLTIHRKWPEAIEECRVAIRLNPFDLEARQTLVFSCLQLGRKDLARAEFERMMALDPPNPDSLRRLFGSQLSGKAR